MILHRPIIEQPNHSLAVQVRAVLQPTPSPGRGAHIEHHHYQGIGTQRMSAVKSQFTLRQSDGSRPRAKGLANNLPQLDNRDLFMQDSFHSAFFWPVRLLAYQKSECLTSSQKKMCISSVLIS